MNAKELLSWFQQEGRELRKVAGTVAVALVLVAGAAWFLADRLYHAQTEALQASNQSLRDELGRLERQGGENNASDSSAAAPQLGDRRLTSDQVVTIQRTLRRNLTEPLRVAVSRIDCTQCAAELHCRDCGALQAQLGETLDGIKLIDVTQPLVGGGGSAPDESPEGLIVRGHGIGSDIIASTLAAAGLQFSRQSIPAVFPPMPGQSEPPFQVEIVISRRSLP